MSNFIVLTEKQPKTVLLDTSFLSYLAADYSQDPKIREDQKTTRTWWRYSGPTVSLRITRTVWVEIKKGDQAEAEKRIALASNIESVIITPEIIEFAALLIAEKVIPSSEENDAIHLAACSVKGIDILLTWDVKHLANDRCRRGAAKLATRMGYHMPLIYTPKEYLEAIPLNVLRSPTADERMVYNTDMKDKKHAEDYNPIMEYVHEVQRRTMAKYDNDLHKYCAALMEEGRKAGVIYIDRREDGSWYHFKLGPNYEKIEVSEEEAQAKAISADELVQRYRQNLRAAGL